MSFSIFAALNHLALMYYANVARKNSKDKVRSNTIVSRIFAIVHIHLKKY